MSEQPVRRSVSPYRIAPESGAAGRRGRVHYTPGLGPWPLVVALLLAIPLALWARREETVPSVVTCTTLRSVGEPPCMVTDAHAGGTSIPTACVDTPKELERLMGTSSPFARPLISATHTELAAQTVPNVGAGKCEDVDAGAGSRARAAGAGATIDTSHGISPELAREKLDACARTPNLSGPVQTLTLAVRQRDYTPCALVLLGALGAAFLSMWRRRAVVALDAVAPLLRITERGFFSLARAVVVPLAEVEGVAVSFGPSGFLNGRRVELQCRNGVIPLVAAYTPLTVSVHERAAERLAALVGRSEPALAGADPGARRGLGLALGLALATLLVIGVATCAYLAASRRPPRRLVSTGLVRRPDARDGSTVVLASLAGRSLAIVADADARRVRAVDLPTLSSPRSESGAARAGSDVLVADFGSRPDAMVIDKRGRLFIALPEESAVAVVVAVAGEPRLREIARLATASEPVALAITHDDAALIVISDFGHALQSFRLADLDPQLQVDLPRSPRALALATSGATAYVAHDTGSVLSVVDLSTGAAREESLSDALWLPQTLHERAGRGKEKGASARRELFCASDRTPEMTMHARIGRVGSRLYIPGVIVAPVPIARQLTPDPPPRPSGYFGSPQALQCGGGGSPIPHDEFEVWELAGGTRRAMPSRVFATGAVVSGSAVTSGGAITAGAMPDGCVLPTAAVTDEEHEWLYVACEGPGRIYKVDVQHAQRCTNAEAWGAPFHVADGPTGMALDREGGALLAWSQFEETLTVLPFSPRADVAPRSWSNALAMHLEPAPEWVHPLPPVERDSRASLVARGRALFHSTNDARISSTGAACASCHIDGREDALSWPTPDGMRQTIALAGRVSGTGPYGWTGERPTVPQYIRATFARLGGAGLYDENLDALAAYVESLSLPHIVTRDAASVARGQAIFASSATSCSICHPAAGAFTDTEQHDVGSKSLTDKSLAFDTPSLLGVGGSAPYFHDGRYATLAELLDGTDGAMGSTKQLAAGQRADLLAYLDSIGSEPLPAPGPRAEPVAARDDPPVPAPPRPEPHRRGPTASRGRTGRPGGVDALARDPWEERSRTTTPPPPPDLAFDREAVRVALGAVDVQSCKQGGAPAGRGHVTVTYVPSGVPADVRVDPPYAGTTTGACIEGAFQLARVAPFAGGSVKVGKGFSLE